MVAPLVGVTGVAEGVIVGLDAGDDAGVYTHGGRTFVATVDFITPVCDEPRRFGRVAASNSLSDVWAMGGSPLFALNLCCFPADAPREALTEILLGAADVLRDSGTILLGGHTVEDRELKFGLAVVGQADPARLLTNSAAVAGDRLVLTKPLGTGVLINAFKKGVIDAEGLEPAMRQMEMTNAAASRLALDHGARCATDVTGFGLIGHALAIARGSGVALRIYSDRLPAHGVFETLVGKGVTTGSTVRNMENAEGEWEDRAGLTGWKQELLFDPQTSGGLLVSVPEEGAAALLAHLAGTGHTAAAIGEVVEGPPRVIVDRDTS